MATDLIGVVGNVDDDCRRNSHTNAYQVERIECVGNVVFCMCSASSLNIEYKQSLISQSLCTNIKAQRTHIEPVQSHIYIYVNCLDMREHY